jgi:hypothetical protein
MYCSNLRVPSLLICFDQERNFQPPLGMVDSQAHHQEAIEHPTKPIKWFNNCDL